MKYLFILLAYLICMGNMEANETGQSMNDKKLMQIRILTGEGTKEANEKVNEFLIQNKMTKDNVIDIQLSRSGSFVTIMVVYELDL